MERVCEQKSHVALSPQISFLAKVRLEDVERELRHKSDSMVEGRSVKVRGTNITIHADGSKTETPLMSDGQLQHRADMGSLAKRRSDETIIELITGKNQEWYRFCPEGRDMCGYHDICLLAPVYDKTRHAAL